MVMKLFGGWLNDGFLCFREKVMCCSDDLFFINKSFVVDRDF